MLENTDNNHIKTFLRIKSKNNNEKENKESNCLNISNNNKDICLCLSQENKALFSFDQIFDEKETQKKIFEVIGKPLSSSTLEGFNCSIIFYGKKVTGKTYTLLGKSINEIQQQMKGDENCKNKIYYEYLNNKGILIFCLENIFNNLILNTSYNNYIFNLSISFIEVFDDQILDYFNIENFVDESKFNFEHIFKKKYFSDLNITKMIISSIDEALFLINQGIELRNLIFNESNINGVKGHSIITIYIEKINKETNQAFKSYFNFIEISSYSKISRNNYNISINKSLETFSYIINQLSDNVKRENILFSNSILTNIIKESLGGNSKTSLIVNISPYNTNILESFHSMSFSSKFNNIINNPIINEIISDNIDYEYYNELMTKKERLKNEKNYLLNYLANLNKNAYEKNMENAPKKIINQNQIQKNKENDEDFKKISTEINIINKKIDEINNNIDNKQKEKNVLFDKFNKIHISLFKKNKEIEEKQKEIDKINGQKKETEQLIFHYQKENINMDSKLSQDNLLIKEDKLKNEEEINKLDKEISISKLQIDDKQQTLNNLTEKYNNLLEENKAKINIRKELESIKTNLLKEKEEKLQKIEENKKKYEKNANKSEDIEQKIIDKNLESNNFQKSLNQYEEYENITINNFKKFYNENNKKELENNNKFFDIQKYLPQKENELNKIIENIEEVNKNKIEIYEEQEKIKKRINDYEHKIKKVENENQIYRNQLNNLQEKINSLTLNLICENNKENHSKITQEKNNIINSSILTFDLSNNKCTNFENDLLIFKNNFNLELNKAQKNQLSINKQKLLKFEKEEKTNLKEKQQKINNEIYKFKINQSKNSTYNNKEKSHNQYNFFTIEENMDKIKEKEKIIENYQDSLNTNYNLIKNYLDENEDENVNNINNSKENISISQFKNIFAKFLEKAKKIDEEFELVKKQFQDNGSQYRWISKEAINISLRNNPVLKNYEEISKNNMDNNISIIPNKIDKRITMNDNKNLNDPKNLQIYIKIYPEKRKLADFLNDYPEYKKSTKKASNNYKFLYSHIDNEPFHNNRNNKELSVINSCSEKENKINNISNTTNTKEQFLCKRDKFDKNKFLFQSPNKVVDKGKNNILKTNYSNNNESYKNIFKNTTNKNNLNPFLKPNTKK